MAAGFAAVQGLRVVHNLPKWHWEDGRHFHHNRQQIHSIVDCFVEPSAWVGGAEATYRPLSANLYYLAGRTLAGNRIEVYHAVDAMAHVVNGVLLFLLCRRMLPGLVALVPPVIFVTRLALVQDFIYTSNFDTLAYTAAALLGLLLFVRAPVSDRLFYEGLALVAFGVALLCKEAAVVWPAIITVHGWLFDRTTAWRKYVPPWITTALWIVFYRRMIHLLYPAGTVGFALDFSPPGITGRYAAYLLCVCNALVPAVNPDRAGWGIPPHVAALAVTRPMTVLVAVLVALDAIVVGLARWRPHRIGATARIAAFGFTWFLVATAPFVILADRLFMRYSYLGQAGLAITAGAVASALAQWCAGTGVPASLWVSRP